MSREVLLEEVRVGKKMIAAEASFLEYIPAIQDLSKVGGLDRLRKWITDRQPLFSSKALESGLPIPRGILVMGISGDEHTDLMSESELTSGDFSRQYAIDKGKMVEAAGIRLIPFAGSARNPILDVNSGTRDCPCMTGRAMCVGMSKEVGLSIEKRPDLVETYQVLAVFELGAVRTEGKLIQKVQTTD